MALQQTFQDTLMADDNTSSAKDYFDLLKPRVMSLVVFTAFVGIFLAPSHIHWFLKLIALICIAIASGAAGAINMWYDRDIDAIMKRTQKRPIPSGKIEPQAALGFGIFLSVASTMVMGLALNYLAAALLLSSILFYVFIYTIWLKRSTPQNIVIGGAAGALPPVIGWAAVMGSVSLEPMILFWIIFMWTPSHFWALALTKSKEYSDAGVPMLPVTSGVQTTKWHILLYSVLMLPFVFAPVVFGFNGKIYFFVSIFLSAIYLLLAFRVFAKEDYQKPSMQLFFFSIFYLFLEFLSLVIDRVVGA